MSAVRDLTGLTFGCWTVVRDVLGPDGGQRRRVWCRCACGREAGVIVRHLIRAPNVRCLSAGCEARRRARGAA